MKTLWFQKFGLPSVLEIEEVSRPEPREGEALVQVRATAIKSRTGKKHACWVTRGDRSLFRVPSSQLCWNECD